MNQEKINQEQFNIEKPEDSQISKDESRVASAEAEKIRRETMEFFQQMEPLGDVFVGSWGYHLEFDPNAESFYFDHQKKAIGIGPKLIEQFNLTPPEKKFGFLHELGHWAQLFNKPDSYLESFEIPKQKSAQAEARAGAGDKEKIKAFSEQQWRSFFNTFFDIHDNALVGRRTPEFQKGEINEKVVPSLYQEKLFRRDDYSQEPYSEQMIDYLLRQVMAPQAETKVMPEVKQVLNQPVNFFGDQYDSLLDFVKQEIHNPLLDTQELMFRLKQVLMPAFEGLLNQDIQSGKIKIKEKQAGLGEGIGEGTAKDFAEGLKEAQKPSSEKMANKIGQEFKDRAAGQGYSEKEINRMLEIKKSTAGIHEDLRDLWSRFIQRSVEIQQDKKAGFKRGAGISPEKLATELGVLLTKPDQAEIFYRYVPQVEKETIKPKKISLYLLLDLSGSMDQDKRRAVQEVAYAIDKSLIDFYRDAKNSVADQGETAPINIDLENIGFGNQGSLENLSPKNSQEIQERRKIDDLPKKDMEQDLWQGIFKVETVDLGNTYDDQALRAVEDKVIDPEVVKDLEEGNEIVVVLEITDGETATVEESKKLVKSLNGKKAVYARAIQIPGSIYSEEAPKEIAKGVFEPPKILAPTGTFKDVWGHYGRRLEDLAALKQTVFDILQDALDDYL